MKKIFLLAGLLSATLAYAQYFGQNKVQYRSFDWTFIETSHFDIYYYGGEMVLAEFTAEVAEEAYDQIARHLRWDLKKRVSIIVYHSHNDFQQTNVVWDYMVEGIGGVTELFKNRVVLPFEGSYEQFRHVIHHELVHALINDMVYGGSIHSIISGRVRLNIPLWANEGLAEYLSLNWDTQSDMVLRDLSINERIPTVNELNYFMAYKGGQSVWRFIAEKYGREKIGEIYQAMKRTQNAENGFKKALSMDFEDLTEQWHKYLKKEYWPDVAGRDALEDMSKRITDHSEDHNFFNVSPALSPDGSRIAILTDRSGYADIILIDAINGKTIKKLVRGNRSVDFEELKWLQPGISWSPDGRRIVIAAKAGGRDRLYLIDVKTSRNEKLSFRLDGLYTAAWSPDGEQIAFVGNKGRASDIYVYHLKTRELINLTDDIFSDSEPAWSPDGRQIAFVSDRGKWLAARDGFDIAGHDYSQTDIYIIDLETRRSTRLTETPYNENYPVWANTRKVLLYTADRNGIWNLYRHDLAAGDVTPLTNVLTGIFQLSLSQDDRTLVYSGYSKGGWDIYSLSDPLDLNPCTVPETNYVLNKSRISDQSLVDLRKTRPQRSPLDEDEERGRDYSRYVFAPEFQQYNIARYEQEDKAVPLPEDSTKDAQGRYIEHVYKTRFSLDLINGQATFNNVFGFSGTTLFAFSDILGDHQIIFGTELVLTLENSDYFFTYAYLKRRTDYYFTGYHTANFWSYDGGLWTMNRIRHYGLEALVSRPFTRFHRLDFGLTLHRINYQLLTRDNPQLNFELDPQNELSLNTLIPSLAWVFDNAVYGLTGPVSGFRQNSSLFVSPRQGPHGVAFQTMIVDLRRYFRVKRDYSFAGRLMLGRSLGPDAQKFLLGGVPNWIFGYGETDGVRDGSRFRDVLLDDGDTNMLKDIYFSVFALPLRGTRFAERFGTKLALANLEFRFPFINYFALGFPLKIIFGNIRGHTFLDIGAAWDHKQEFGDIQALRARYGNDIPSHFSPLVSSFGWGIKINLGYFLLRLDTAWDINHDGYSKPQYYLSIGPDW